MRLFSILFITLLAAFLFIGAIATGFIKIPAAYNPFAPIDLRAETTFVTPLKLWRLSNSPQLCQAALRDADINFTPAPDRTNTKGCTLDNTVLLSNLGGIGLSPASPQIRCPLAARLVLYAQTLQRETKSLFNSPLAQISHYGTYACRNVYGRKEGRLSKHATANAIDVSAFKLKSGESIAVLKDWDKATQKGVFLKTARNKACHMFSAVLGPDYNAAHKNHFHFDGGFFSRCS
ncbi:MAG: extensin family protein [Pseudomonadota bacterium]